MDRPRWTVPSSKQGIRREVVPERGKPGLYCIHWLLTIIALVAVQGRLVPLCLEVYSQWGNPLPRLTLLMLTVLPQGQWPLTMAIAAVTAAIGLGFYLNGTTGSPFRKVAWLLQSMGTLVLILALLGLFMPIFATRA